MTVLLGVTGTDAIFLAADCRSHVVATGQILPPVRKIETWNDAALWATGGYAAANEEIKPTLPTSGNIDRLNDRIRTSGDTFYWKYRALASQHGLADQGHYSIVMGFDSSGVPVICANSPNLSQYIKAIGTNRFIGLGTDSAYVHAVGEQKLFTYPTFKKVPADTFALEVIALVANRYPLQVGFPVDLAVIRRGCPPEMCRIMRKEDHIPADTWLI
jgi:hypothetical protein